MTVRGILSLAGLALGSFVTLELIALADAPRPLFAQPEGTNFVASLSGDEEVPPRETRGHGVAQFQLNREGTEIRYHLNVANIENVFRAHIHAPGAPGVNAGIVVFLMPDDIPPGTDPNGLLVRGTITAANLTGTLAGQPLSVLIDHMRAGNAYVNVHTNDGIGATNTGPGDFPGGEIRGQIRAAP